jgi:hypothetical protein
LPEAIERTAQTANAIDGDIAATEGVSPRGE